jgi:ATP-binding cassette subfamily B protein
MSEKPTILGITMYTTETFSSLLRLFDYIKPYRMRATAATACTVLHNLFDIVPDLLLGVAIDVVVNKNNSFLSYIGITSFAVQLGVLGFLTLFFWSCEALFEYLSELLWRNLAQTIQHSLRIQAYGHMQSLEMAYFENKNAGELLTILNDDVNQLEHFFDKGVTDFIYFVVNVCVVSVIFLYLSPMVALFAFFPIPGILFIAYKFQGRLGNLYTSVREHAGILGARITNNIIGIATIKSYTKEKYELERLENDSRAYKEKNGLAIGVSAAFIPAVRIAIACGFVATIVLGGWSVLQGTLAVGSYSVLIYMTQRLLWPFIYLAKITDVYKRSMASAQRIFTIVDTPVGIHDGEYETTIETVKGKIEFKDVSFVYPSGVQIFDNLSISVEPGQVVGFVGSTGSGKTTLIKLLLRFYDPHTGDILLDGMYTKKLKLHALRRLFGFVSQDVYLFKGTIRENIAYGAHNATHTDIEEAAKIAEIHNFIMGLPDGYETVVGEYGQKLSGGQKQRISIARALVNKPPIFIFDEATSSVDNETEALIQQSLQKIAKRHTIFIIAHRLSSVRHADTIFVFNNGSMIEHGKHDDLINLNGIYAKLWHIQTGQY